MIERIGNYWTVASIGNWENNKIGFVHNFAYNILPVNFANTTPFNSTRFELSQFFISTFPVLPIVSLLVKGLDAVCRLLLSDDATMREV